MLVIYLILLIFFSFLLIKATEILIEALNRLSKNYNVSKFAITSFFMALTTSLPELFVCVTAALEKKSNLALGNILGSNIADISLIIGGAALIGGSISVVGDFLKKEIFYAFAAGLFPLVLLIDGNLSRVDGLLLIFIYGFYNYTVLSGKKKRNDNSNGITKKLIRRLNYKRKEKTIAWIFLGAVLLIFSADMIVRVATLIAQSFKVPIFLIGLFLVAVGTSLPELSFELKAVRKKEVGMVFGDLLGSIVANSSLIIGLTAFISPIILGGYKDYLWAAIGFLCFFLLFWFFVRTKKKLERWEGLVLIMIYLGFIFFEFWWVKQNQNSIFFVEPLP